MFIFIGFNQYVLANQKVGEAKYFEKIDFVLDGIPNEDFWDKTPSYQDFTQFFPNGGDPATEHTQAKIAYDNKFVYVSAKMFDSDSGAIAATLFRKDGGTFSDWFEVHIDSYNDQRTAFGFGVNPKGVRRDFLFFNDTDSDMSWEAVWQGAAHVHDWGWTVEMKIPLSQIRYDAKVEDPRWGINFARRIARKNEINSWSPIKVTDGGYVSKFNQIDGLSQLSEPRRLEIIPYVSEQMDVLSSIDSADPFAEKRSLNTNVGLDLRYGIGADFTLTSTFNPDFGQAELDPAVVNLTAFEVFFPERRAFFLEGTDIFRFGDTRTRNISARPTLFYSRRIGRRPVGSLPDDAEFSDYPLNSTIAMASKFSGKTNNGFTVGIMDAITTRQHATVQMNSGNQIEHLVEPATNFFVARFRKDIDNGKTVVGGMVNAVNRGLSDTGLENQLRESAYVGGVDFEHSWKDREWVVSGVLAASTVNGSEAVITEAQTNSTRFYNRPDADYLSVDSSATSLGGTYAAASIFRRGEKMIQSFTVFNLTPGFETNDLGFQTIADRRGANFLMEYQQNAPIGKFQEYSLWIGGDYVYNFGGDLVEHDYFGGAYFRFRSFRGFEVNYSYSPNYINDRLTRGGPVTTRPSDYSLSGRIHSDVRKDLTASVRYRWRADVTGEFDKTYSASLNWRPAPNMELSPGIEFTEQFDNDQYITKIQDVMAVQTYGVRYVFADIDQSTFAANIRVNWTFAPDLSLQVFAQPFITSGKFYNYKEFAREATFDFDIYGEDKGSIVQDDDGNMTITPDDDPESTSFSVDNQDFNFASLRGNAVLRWEFRPGTILFLVWQQNRQENINRGHFDFGEDVRRMVTASGNNTFLVKLAYWFG